MEMRNGVLLLKLALCLSKENFSAKCYLKGAGSRSSAKQESLLRMRRMVLYEQFTEALLVLLRYDNGEYWYCLVCGDGMPEFMVVAALPDRIRGSLLKIRSYWYQNRLLPSSFLAFLILSSRRLYFTVMKSLTKFYDTDLWKRTKVA